MLAVSFFGGFLVGFLFVCLFLFVWLVFLLNCLFGMLVLESHDGSPQ